MIFAAPSARDARLPLQSAAPNAALLGDDFRSPPPTQLSARRFSRKKRADECDDSELAAQEGPGHIAAGGDDCPADICCFRQATMPLISRADTG